MIKVFPGLLIINFIFLFNSCNDSKSIKYASLIETGDSLIQMDQYDMAFNHFNEAILLDRSRAEGYYGVGYCKMRLEEYAAALEYLDKSVKINPNYRSSYFNRAVCNYHLQMLTEALEDIEMEMAIDSLDPDNYALRADINSKLWEHKKALADINKAITINNKVGKYYFIRGLIFMNLADTAYACQDFKTSRDLGDGSSFISSDNWELYLRWCHWQ